MSIQKLVILVALAIIVISLFSALVYMVKDRGDGTRAVRALTWRVSLSLLLLVLIGLGYNYGLLHPGGTQV